MMLRNILAILRFDTTMDLRLAMNGGRHRRGLATQVWVEMVMAVVAMASCAEDFTHAKRDHFESCRCHAYELHGNDGSTTGGSLL